MVFEISMFEKYSAFCCIIITLFLSGCRHRPYYAHISKFPDQSTRATCAVRFDSDQCDRTKEPMCQEPLVAPVEMKRKFNELSFMELQRILDYTKATENKEIAVKAVQHMIPLCNDQIRLEKLRIEIADLYFDLGKLEQAEKLYKEFVALYPNSPHTEYALYKEILCRYYDILSCDRDQTITQETLVLTQRYLSHSEVYKQYITDVQSIEKHCYNRLFEHELSIFDFYINKGNYKAAQKRLDAIKTKFDKRLIEQEQTILVAEIELAKLQKDTALVALKEAELIEKFPQTKSSIVAQAKKTYVTLF